jgi:ribA/ribD-fused uncharacterized protein
MADELKKFYAGREKHGKDRFDYDDDGNLVERNKQGAVVKTISLPIYRPITLDEFKEMDEARTLAIREAIEAFDRARMALFEEMQKGEFRDLTRVLALNEEVATADIRLQKVRFPHRMYEREELQIRKIDFTQPNETRKFPYLTTILRVNPYPITEQYVRVGEPVEKPLISLEEARSEQVVLFGDASNVDYGFLSLDWEIALEIQSIVDGRSTMYQSATQAILGELAKFFQDQEHLEKIMTASSPDDIQYTVEDVPGNRDENEVRWKDQYQRLLYEVNLKKYTQYPELALRLLQTGQMRLGAYKPKDNLIGIGLSSDDARAKNPTMWSGQNQLGMVLMRIRDALREQQEQQAKAQQQAPVKKAIRKPRRAAASLDAAQPKDATAPADAQPKEVPMGSAPAVAQPLSMVPVAAPMEQPFAQPLAQQMAAPSNNAFVAAAVPMAAPPSSVSNLISSQAAPVAQSVPKPIRRRPEIGL